jgi:RNA polymerase sigma-70 factor, ECF subfamily
VSTAPGTPVVATAVVERLFARARADRWGLPVEVLAAAVERAVTRRFAAPAPAPEAVDAFVATLHAEDLALACACAEGAPAAWDHFVLTYRPELYRAARAMSDEATGRELADSLYADLFGLDASRPERRSLFRYYHGRAKLSTWLRSVLAQRHVDVVRARRRFEPLDDPRESRSREIEAPPAPDPAQRAAMRLAADAVTTALAELAADERVRLAYCYVHGLTLAQTGRLFGESEATASRKLDRARRALREAIASRLESSGLAVTDVEDWAAVAREAWDTSLVEALDVGPPQDAGPPSFKEKRTP